MLTIGSEGRWPISFVGEVGNTRYTFTPHSDFLFLLKGCPFLFIEICSDRNHEMDRYRMLLQAGLLVRVMNAISKQPFIAVAIYINSKFTAERYLVYQNSERVRTIYFLTTDFSSSLYFYCRPDMSVMSFPSWNPLKHSSSFSNYITSPPPYPPITKTSPLS